jgi:hypothetical protein
MTLKKTNNKVKPKADFDIETELREAACKQSGAGQWQLKGTAA